jgi:hypothetical protein
MLILMIIMLIILMLMLMRDKFDRSRFRPRVTETSINRRSNR